LESDPINPPFEAKVCDPVAFARRVATLARPLVFTNGVFDILHRGHVTYLAEARALGASLVVALNSDASVRRLGKGDDRPINALTDRAAVVAALESVLKLSEYPRVLHRSAADQNAVRTGFPPTTHSILNGCNVTVARNGNAYGILYGFDQLPVGKTLITLFARTTVYLYMLNSALLGHFCNIDHIDRSIRITRAQLKGQRDRDRLLDLFQYLFESWKIS